MVSIKQILTRICQWIADPIIYGNNSYRVIRSDTGTDVEFKVEGGNHGIYSNTLNKWLIRTDNNTVYVNEFDMGRYVITSGWFTPNSSEVASITTTDLVKWGDVVTFSITGTIKNAITANAYGNFTDIVLGTIVQELRPQGSAVYCTSNGNTLGNCSNWFYINTSGEIKLSAVEGTGASRTIAAGSTFYCRGSYLI